MLDFFLLFVVESEAKLNDDSIDALYASNISIVEPIENRFAKVDLIILQIFLNCICVL